MAETTQGEVRSKVVKICLNGKCKDIQVIPNNGFPVRCKVSVELSRDLRMTYPIHFIELYVPAEFGSLLGDRPSAHANARSNRLLNYRLG